MPACVSCNSANGADSTFCAYCGAELPTGEPAARTESRSHSLRAGAPQRQQSREQIASFEVGSSPRPGGSARTPADTWGEPPTYVSGPESSAENESRSDLVGGRPNLEDTDPKMPAVGRSGAQSSGLLKSLLLPLIVAAGIVVAISIWNRNESPPVATESTFSDSAESISRSSTPPMLPTGMSTLNAQHFTISYPRGWVVQQLETAPAGTNYLDTSIRRTVDDPNFLIRIDMLSMPTSGSSVDQTIEALEEKAGFKLLARDEDPLHARGGTYPAETMEFLLLNTDTGMMMRSVDTFFVDEQGRTFALLTRTPAGVWHNYEELLEEVRESIDPT